MLRIFKLLLLLTVLMYSCDSKEETAQQTAKEESYKLTGVNASDDYVFLYKVFDGRLHKADSAQVVEGTFSLTGKVDSVSLHFLKIDRKFYPLLLDNQEISIAMNKDFFYASELRGIDNGIYARHMQRVQDLIKAEQTLFREMRKAIVLNNEKELQNLKARFQETEKKMTALHLDFIEENKKDPFALYLLDYEFNKKSIDIEKTSTLLNDLAFQDSDVASRISQAIAIQQKEVEESVEAGTKNQAVKKKTPVPKKIIRNPAPNFSGNSPDDTPISLSNVRANAKVVLLDFWASWCGPCRMQNPYLVRLHKRYHSKGFEIISIAEERPDTETDWRPAILQDGLDWHHILDTDQSIASKYGVYTLPHTVLVDKEGYIIYYKTDIREIESYLEANL